MRKNNERPRVDEFDSWASHISKKILAARKAESAGRARLLRESEWGATAFFVYEYVQELESEELFDDLEWHLGRSPGPRPSRSCLVLRLVNSARPRKAILSPSQRSKMADMLEIARKLDIEPALILGFLSEIGSQKVVADISPDSVKLLSLSSYRRKRSKPA